MARKQTIDLRSGEDADIDAMLKRRAAREIARAGRGARKGGPAPAGAHFGGQAGGKPNDDLKSFFTEPLAGETNYYSGGVGTASPMRGRAVSYRILRRVAEKAWIINLCISTSISQARPYFREAAKDGERGFRIRARKAVKEGRDMSEAEKKEAERLADFFLRTGDCDDPGRSDDLDKYASKTIRDLYQLDQIACELQRTRGGELCAFWAVDAATIEAALPGVERETGVRYAQVINGLPYAYYGRDELIFDCMNPRTDIEKAGYGYSVVEQAIDLVTSSINTFMYNSGFFTENKLPRGMLLLNGPADQDEVDDIEDYIVEIMSGNPSGQWRIPIIPSGRTPGEGGGGKMLEWVQLQGNNQEMQYQAWYDLLLSAITALFQKSLEELGLHSSKSQPLFAGDNRPKIEASKSLGLGCLLAFMGKHLNDILRLKNPDYVFEFVGYEKDDLKLMSEIDKAEIDSWKTLNEKRAEKGAQPLDFTKTTNPADLPMSPQAAQLWQAGQGMGGGGPPDDDEDNDEDNDDDGEGSGWDDLEDSEGRLQKSLGGRPAPTRIAI